jgi:putative SOS response-associated peptidase YedK
MCGRYASTASPAQLAAEFDVDDILDGLPGPDYNVAPTVVVPAVFERVDRAGGSVRRRLTPLVWGLVPSWAKDRSIGSRLINARLETVADKSAFAKAFRSRRCLLPAAGFYEWYVPEGTPGGPKGAKQPFFLHRADGGLLVMAGIYEIWRDPTKNRDDDSGWLRSCSVITTQATDAAGHIHDRMPVLVPAAAVDGWLDPGVTDPAEALALVAVPAAADLAAYAVSTAVNKVANNDPTLLEPLAESTTDEQERLL